MKQPEKMNYGFGGFSDQYDNNRMRSMDRDQHPGSVTGVPFEDDFDIEKMIISQIMEKVIPGGGHVLILLATKI